MSTCRGAAPPHNDCVHGDACDWVEPFNDWRETSQAKKAHEEEALLRAKYPDNRQGRRALERALKKRGNR